MSYDWPDDVPYPPRKKPSIIGRVSATWFRFVIWCALDAKSSRLNEWGLRRLEGKPKR